MKDIKKYNKNESKRTEILMRLTVYWMSYVTMFQSKKQILHKWKIKFRKELIVYELYNED